MLVIILDYIAKIVFLAFLTFFGLGIKSRIKKDGGHHFRYAGICFMVFVVLVPFLPE